MAEKNDDIKQLFTHLGLNPSDYQEIRNAARVPDARTESSQSARRWSLLDSIASRPAVEPASPSAAAPVVNPAAGPAVSAPPTIPPARELSRAEIERESLQSFFEAVKEPLPSATLDGPQDGPSIPATVEIRGAVSTAVETGGIDEPAAARIADLVRSRWPAETASVPGGESAAAPPAPASAAVRSAEAATVAAGDARLRLKYGVASQAEAPTGESLAAVFRRLDAAGLRR